VLASREGLFYWIKYTLVIYWDWRLISWLLEEPSFATIFW
jgi:hypothetical protein